MNLSRQKIDEQQTHHYKCRQLQNCMETEKHYS